MNIIILPYHDWRKIIREGVRTRDAHFIETLRSLPEVEKILIINRPFTLLELILKKKNIKLQAKRLMKSKGNELLQLDNKTYLADFEFHNIFKHAIMGRSWYSYAYSDKQVLSFTKKSIDILRINENTLILSQNILAAPFCQNFSSFSIVFDAWDNFMLMPGLSKIKKLLSRNYQLYSKISAKWYTNSQQNIKFYSEHYAPTYIELLKNGVDLKRFTKKYVTPDDLKFIPTPIIGFGGKITHLVDADLFKYIIEHNPDKSFVILGQVLDKGVFKRIGNYKNLHYLGDKHYDEYPAYVTNFDIGIIPYKTGSNQHGGDSIKAYEYLAAGIKVVGTNDNGVETLSEHVYVVGDKLQFHNAIQNTQNQKKSIDLDIHSWESKARTLVNEFRNL